MSLKGIAQKTLGILNEGRYIAPSGKTIEIARALRAAVDATVLYRPEEGAALLAADAPGGKYAAPIIEVTGETIQVAAHRLVQKERVKDLVLLNYASARNAGGGFINGAKAQGEDLTRCSGLYPCLLTQPDYYEANRQDTGQLYTDHVIYSPAVPWFRTRRRNLLDKMYLASAITAPAPNAAEALRLNPEAWPIIEQTIRHRTGLVLAMARAHKHRTLLLGPWGLGPRGPVIDVEGGFRNRPEIVADAFGAWIESPLFAGCFNRVVFAVYDRTRDRATLRAFEERFPA